MLDQNGYAPSILTGHGPDCCFLCGRNGHLDRHEIFGASNRQKSKRIGLWVHLCRSCHESVHHNAVRMKQLHRFGQIEAMRHYHWTVDEFREQFGKNHLEEDES